MSSRSFDDPVLCRMTGMTAVQHSGDDGIQPADRASAYICRPAPRWHTGPVRTSADRAVFPVERARRSGSEADRVVDVRLVIMADTHLPKRARDLPPQLWAAVDKADVVIHAGDWVQEPLLDALESRAARLIGVYGNNDGPELRARLPEIARVDLAGLRVAVVHETGPAVGRERRCAVRFSDRDLLVFGHSHIPWDSEAPGGLRLLNPGSPTDRRRQPYATYLTAEISDGRLDSVVRHTLPRR